MSQKESPGEVFKRALAHAARSLAEQPDLEVVFSGDGPSLVGQPGDPAASAARAFRARDHAASAASPTRWPCASPTTTMAFTPRPSRSRWRAPRSTTPSSRRASRRSAPTPWPACARTWRRSGNRPPSARGWTTWAIRATAPMADIVALMVRERLTGSPPPPAAQALVDALARRDRGQGRRRSRPADRRGRGSEGLRPHRPRPSSAICPWATTSPTPPTSDSEEEENQEGEPEASTKARARARSSRRRARRSTIPRRATANPRPPKAR